MFVFVYQSKRQEGKEGKVSTQLTRCGSLLLILPNLEWVYACDTGIRALMEPAGRARLKPKRGREPHITIVA